MHHYHKLRDVLGTHPIGAPESPEFLEILKILFPPGQVELAVHLDFRLKGLGEIARLASMPEQEAMQKLEALADRGAVLAKKMNDEYSYALLPNYPGLFEYPFMKGGDAATQQRLASLWHAYYMKAMAEELAAASPPWNRVFPAEEALTEDYEILPYEVASGMLEKAGAIGLANCPCRISEKNCEKPLDVCLSFDGAARFLAERGMASIITLEEAKAVLKKSEEAGLVHTGSNMQEKLVFLCNCCSCCCHFLRLVTEHNYPHALANSSYQASLDVTLCTGCGVCAQERCPVRALTMGQEVALFNAEKCIGCGLCVSTCPSGALKLVKRENYSKPPETSRELVQRVVASKSAK